MVERITESVRRGRTPTMVLPAEFAEKLASMYEYYGRPMSWQLVMLLAHARDAGWTLQSLANALGMTRERMRQILEPVKAADYPPPPPGTIPAVPVKPARPVKPPPPQLTGEQAAQLRDLNRQANVRGKMSPDRPEVAAARLLAQTLHNYRKQGYRLAHLAEAMGVTAEAVHFRLGRWGFGPLAPTQRKGPGPSGAHLRYPTNFDLMEEGDEQL